MDYGKWRYEQEQRAKQARKHQSTINIKEIKLRPKIGDPRLRDQEGPRRPLPEPAGEGEGHDHVPGAGEPPPGARVGCSSTVSRRTSRRSARSSSSRRIDGRNMVMVLGPTKNAGVKRDAEGEDRERSEEAVQGERGRESCMRRHAMQSHNLTKKSSKRKRDFGKSHRRREGRREGRQEAPGDEVAMPRVKRSVHARKKRRKVLEQAKGYYGRKSTHYRYAKEQVEHSLVYAYRDRRNKKRNFRSLWIVRINAAARANGLSYNQFIERRPQGGHRARPQVARRPRGRRPGCVRGRRRAGQGRARVGRRRESGLSELAGTSSAGRRSTSRRSARRSMPGWPSASPTIRASGPRSSASDERWDVPLRLFAARPLSRALRRRARRAERPFEDFAAALARARGCAAGAASRRRACRRTRCSAACSLLPTLLAASAETGLPLELSSSARARA